MYSMMFISYNLKCFFSSLAISFPFLNLSILLFPHPQMTDMVLSCVAYPFPDVASQTFTRNCFLSVANLPASLVLIPIHSSTSCSHLRVGQPLPLFPSTFASNMCFSNVWCLFICPKYCNLCFLILFSSQLDDTSTFRNTSSFFILSIHETLNILR